MTDDSLNLPDEIPWPQKGDQLFGVGDDKWHNACLNYMPDDWELYVLGYKQAADALVEHVKSTHRHQDSLVFPIVFLYRQYLELCLKQLIRDGNALLDQPPDFPKIHPLDKVWEVCRPILKKAESGIPEKDLQAIDDAIAQFCEIDPSSETFRYPTNKKNRRSLPSDLRYINLRNLAEVMEKIASFLDSAAMMISVYLENKQEMERTYRDAYGGFEEF